MSHATMGTLDHIHLVVSDREEAARWYEDTLGFKRVLEFSRWGEIAGGPLHLSCDGGLSSIALFEAWDNSKEITIGMGAGFKVDADAFMAFALSLERLQLTTAAGERLGVASVVDFELCYSYGFVDPYGNQLELNCYDHATVKSKLIEPNGIEPIRLW